MPRKPSTSTASKTSTTSSATKKRAPKQKASSSGGTQKASGTKATAKKTADKKTADKKTAAKKSATKKKPAAKKAPAKTKKRSKSASAPSKKPAAKSSTATKKKATAKKSTAKKKSAVKKAPAKTKKRTKTAPGTRAPRRRVAKVLTVEGEAPVKKAESVVKGKPLNKRELKKFQKLLLELRERLLGDIDFLTTDNLHRAGRETGADLSGAAQHSADHGTDNFDREFALSLASTEQDVLYEVDEALLRIEDGEYGVCEMSGVQIERARLEVIPYTRYSVQAQAKMERGRARYRPFGQTFKGW